MDSEYEPNTMTKIQATISEILALLVYQYDTDFSKYINPFVETVYNLLTTVGQHSKYDIVYYL